MEKKVCIQGKEITVRTLSFDSMMRLSLKGLDRDLVELIFACVSEQDIEKIKSINVNAPSFITESNLLVDAFKECNPSFFLSQQSTAQVMPLPESSEKSTTE